MKEFLDDWRTHEYECPKCQWKGIGLYLNQDEAQDGTYHLSCPNCRSVLEEVRAPSEDQRNVEISAMAEALNTVLLENPEGSRAMLLDQFDQEKLRSPEQLPDVEERDFVVTWDQDGDGFVGNILIKLGDRVLFREPLLYENYQHFAEVAEILKQKYGDRIKDFTPTERSETYLYGDDYSGPRVVQESRARLFGVKS